MQPRHADIVVAQHLAAELLGGDPRLLGDRHVGRPRSQQPDPASAGGGAWRVRAGDNRQATAGVDVDLEVAQLTSQLTRPPFGQPGHDRPADPSRQLRADLDDLRQCLALGQHRLGDAGAARPSDVESRHVGDGGCFRLSRHQTVTTGRPAAGAPLI